MINCLASPPARLVEVAPSGKIKRSATSTAGAGGRLRESMSGGGGLRPYASRQRHWLISTILEFDGHKDHLAIAEIFKIMHFELAFAVALVPGLAWLVGVLDGGAVMHMLPPTPTGNRSPEIIQHVTVEADALAGGEADDPYAGSLIFR